ncbi:MAG: thermonuclease family protein [Alphaproteobacteria bacterium]|nr:thermonuclease family protein [Alphaproteobacteria bacterium]
MLLLLKRILIGAVVLFMVYVGGNGVQDTTTLLQGSGMVGLAVGVVVLYIFGKFIWKAMGCLPSLIVLGGIVFFLLYTTGALNGGVENIIPNIKNFLEVKSRPASESNKENNALMLLDEPETPAVTIGENFGDVEYNKTADSTQPSINSASESPSAPASASESAATPETQSGGIMGFVNNLIGGDNTQVSQTKSFNPNDYPPFSGAARVVSGDTFVIRGRYIRLFGIDAPEVKQTCANSKGRPYACGKEAMRWLQDWILDNEIDCRILKQDAKGNAVATCSYGQYDIGAALVTAGWAVVLPENTIYQPYELQAQRARRGMWQGQFYKPWDWIKIQSKKPKIKIIKPDQKRLWDYL